MKQTIPEHLSELRMRLLVFFIFFVSCFVLFYLFSDWILSWLVQSVLDVVAVSIVNLSMIEFFVAKIKLSFVLALLPGLPILLYHFLAFLKPALTTRERKTLKHLWRYLPFSLLLFLLSTGFFYFSFYNIILPFVHSRSLQISIHPFWSISQLIDNLLLFFIPLVLAFQLPVIVIMLFKSRIISREFLIKKRKVFYVLVFIVASVFTPPDVVSQIIVAFPMLLLFEFSCLLLWLIEKR